MVLQQKRSSPIGIWMWSHLWHLFQLPSISPSKKRTRFNSDLQSENLYEALRDPDVLLQVGELKKDLPRIQPMRWRLVLGCASKRIQKGPNPQLFPQRWTIWGAAKHHLIARPHFLGSTKKQGVPHPSDFSGHPPDHSVNASGGWFDLPLDVIRCHWVCTNLEKTATKSSLGEGVEI